MKAKYEHKCHIKVELSELRIMRELRETPPFKDFLDDLGRVLERSGYRATLRKHFVRTHCVSEDLRTGTQHGVARYLHISPMALPGTRSQGMAYGHAVALVFQVATQMT